MNSGEVASRLGLKGIPPMAEVIMVERDLRLAEMTGARYHAACLSTGEALESMRRGKQRGLKVTCGAAAHSTRQKIADSVVLNEASQITLR